MNFRKKTKKCAEQQTVTECTYHFQFTSINWMQTIRQRAKLTLEGKIALAVV